MSDQSSLLNSKLPVVAAPQDGERRSWALLRTVLELAYTPALVTTRPLNLLPTAGCAAFVSPTTALGSSFDAVQSFPVPRLTSQSAGTGLFRREPNSL